MKRIPFKPADKADIILNALPKGILLTTALDGKLNTMTIGWGAMGTDWALPTFTVLVRDSRFTKTYLDKTGEFTINIPLPGSDVRQILNVCGSLSGRTHDKFAELGLTAVPGGAVNVPAIAQLPITLECKVLYRQHQKEDAIPENILRRFYPTGDFHEEYIAQIVNAYILEED